MFSSFFFAHYCGNVATMGPFFVATAGTPTALLELMRACGTSHKPVPVRSWVLSRAIGADWGYCEVGGTALNGTRTRFDAPPRPALGATLRLVAADFPTWRLERRSPWLRS